MNHQLTSKMRHRSNGKTKRVNNNSPLEAIEKLGLTEVRNTNVFSNHSYMDRSRSLLIKLQDQARGLITS